MGVNDSEERAQREIERARARMTEITEELARRATPAYAKARMKEAALERTIEIREKVVGSPLVVRIAGATLGAVLASWLARKYQARKLSPLLVPVVPQRVNESQFTDASGPRVGIGISPSGGVAFAGGGGVSSTVDSVKESGASAVDSVKDAASGAAQTVKDAVHSVGDSARRLADRVPAPSDVAMTTRGWYERAVNEQPLAIALGTLALGAIAAALLPVTEPERRALSPMKDKLRGAIQSAAAKVEGQLSSRDGQSQQQAIVPFDSQGQQSSAQPQQHSTQASPGAGAIIPPYGPDYGAGTGVPYGSTEEGPVIKVH